MRSGSRQSQTRGGGTKKGMPCPKKGLLIPKKGPLVPLKEQRCPKEGQCRFMRWHQRQFEVESLKALEVRSRMKALQTQLKGIMIKRDQADDAQNALFFSVANSIRGNPDFGLNSPLYRSLGFVPLIEHKRPKRR